MSFLGQRSFLVLRAQSIFEKMMIQTMVIAIVMTHAKMCKPSLSNTSPITPVAVICTVRILVSWGNSLNEEGGKTYESSVRKDKRPPCHLEWDTAPCAKVLPQGADANDEEPHGEAPEPETDEDADDFDDGGDVWGADKGRRDYDIDLVA